MQETRKENSKKIKKESRPILLPNEPAAVVANVKEKEELLRLAEKLEKGSNFVLLLNAKVNVQRILPAYLNAIIRYKEGIARAKKASMEMLLLLSGKKNISEAVKECGVKENETKTIIFATSSQILNRFLKVARIKAKKEPSLTLDFDKAAKVAEMDL